MGNSQGKPVVFTDEVNLHHFRLLRVVGKGAFGKVRIVERKDTGLTFALKYIRKDEVVQTESVRNIIRERRMLQQLNHPFLCNLRYSFQDYQYLYLVVDLMNGGDIRFHISRRTFTEDAIRFWLAELGCALRYIHQQGIVHRDVKPDNILLDGEGHIHLADFNVASNFSPRRPLTSRSGTLAYLAPEVYSKEGYLDEVDWWAMGVTFYECIYNKRPFEARTHDGLTNEIMAANPRYPLTRPAVSPQCVSAMTSLLEKDKTKRIGAAGFETFTDHPFFQPIDFVALERKEIEPVFRPSADKANFDATYDLEELLLEEAPLEARTRRQRPRDQLRADASEKEIREDELHKMIETLFEPFDYTTVSYSQPPPLGECSDHPPGTKPVDLLQPPPRAVMAEGSVSPSPSEPTSPIFTPGTKSVNGSPPLPPQIMGPPGRQQPPFPGQNPETYGVGEAISTDHATTIHRPPAPRPRGGTKTVSASGGVQVVLDGAGSWSDLADRSSTMPAEGFEGIEGRGTAKPGGMLGFLSRKKGRDRSPKPLERGIIGKDGARVIIE
ncbi:serine/threonine protein kinase [Xylona heveae TC161]|uniref:non-specific serine/threonine protein kinase n=1 Tax=Xylona heveae (strain CBS 132557 / TC161) TaxID=1328760 RepID=A0A165FL32_XYLHT|nr:serine/threonine protein kinase [Xylona heveae TC161]KZF21102.1 serine/threonine protein kinase [Xylona heveae TC161]